MRMSIRMQLASARPERAVHRAGIGARIQPERRESALSLRRRRRSSGARPRAPVQEFGRSERFRSKPDSTARPPRVKAHERVAQREERLDARAQLLAERAEHLRL